MDSLILLSRLTSALSVRHQCHDSHTDFPVHLNKFSARDRLVVKQDGDRVRMGLRQYDGRARFPICNFSARQFRAPILYAQPRSPVWRSRCRGRRVGDAAKVGKVKRLHFRRICRSFVQRNFSTRQNKGTRTSRAALKSRQTVLEIAVRIKSRDSSSASTASDI